MHLCSVPRQKCQGGGAAVAAASAASHRTLRWYKGPALPPAATENNSSFSSYINSCSRSCANIRKNCLSAIPSNACSGGNCYSYFIRKEKERSPTQGGSPSWQKGRLPSAYLYSKDSDSDLQAQRLQVAGNTTKSTFAQSLLHLNTAPLEQHLLPSDQKGAELTLTTLLARELPTSELNCTPPANSD